MNKITYTPENISSLGKNEVFVFGSNINGEHIGGAAYVALQKFGARMGQGQGLQGQSYAIPTCVRVTMKDKGDKIVRYTKPFDSVADIKPYVDAFIKDAVRLDDKVFYVTKIGCGIAGFEVNEIAELFRPCLDMVNVILPKEFVDYLGE